MLIVRRWLMSHKQIRVEQSICWAHLASAYNFTWNKDWSKRIQNRITK